MAELRNKESGRVVTVEPEFLVGRSRAAALSLDKGYVSTQHAELRWNGNSWEVRDLGSRNGTTLDGNRLSPGKHYSLLRRAELAFGSAGEAWELVDDAPPTLMAVPMDGGAPNLAEDGMLGLPSSNEPQVSIFRDASGSWVLEKANGEALVVEQRSVVEVDGKRYRLSFPEVSGRTSTLDHSHQKERVALEFSVSRDEENVGLSARIGDHLTDLGCRAHNYILLTLARQRLADRAEEHAEPACGWVYQDELIGGLGLCATQFNVEVFRIRQHFARAGLEGRISPVERRPRSKQVRIGVSELHITRL
jgi:hypothetical protein